MLEKQILNHLEQLVSFSSASADQAAVLRLLQYCADVLEKTGAFKDITFHEDDGFHSLTASTQGTKTPKVLLQGHVDVVPAPTELVYSLDKSSGKLFGRGVLDMLFATACYLTFIENNKAVLDKLDFGVMLTGDEELGGDHGVAYLLNQGYGCEICILPDAGRNYGDLNVAAKGVFNFDLVVEGRAHHGSRPWEGDGAANKLVELLHEFIATFNMEDRDNSTITVAILEAGDAENKGPSRAKARLDIRYKDKTDLRLITARLDELSARFQAHREAVHNGSDYQLDVSHPLVEQFITLFEKKLGRPVTMHKAFGSSDARFFSEKGIPVIMTRPDGLGAHGDEEYLELAHLVDFYEVVSDYVLETAKLSTLKA